eukprot:scaffold287_cov337-Pavlova_lutheri.AAC.61
MVSSRLPVPFPCIHRISPSTARRVRPTWSCRRPSCLPLVRGSDRKATIRRVLARAFAWLWHVVRRRSRSDQGPHGPRYLRSLIGLGSSSLWREPVKGNPGRFPPGVDRDPFRGRKGNGDPFEGGIDRGVWASRRGARSDACRPASVQHRLRRTRTRLRLLSDPHGGDVCGWNPGVGRGVPRTSPARTGARPAAGTRGVAAAAVAREHGRTRRDGSRPADEAMGGRRHLPAAPLLEPRRDAHANGRASSMHGVALPGRERQQARLLGPSRAEARVLGLSSSTKPMATSCRSVRRRIPTHARRL